MIYQFAAAFLGKEILNAEFVVRNTHSAVCEDHRVDLWRTKAINSATTWTRRRPRGFWMEQVGSASFSYGGLPERVQAGGGCARFDVNPKSGHVQELGSHLNLETQINGEKVKSGPLADPHTPIDPSTIRPGDY